MLSDKLAVAFLQTLDDEITQMRIVLDNDESLIASVSFSDVEVNTDELYAKRIASADFNVSAYWGRRIVEVRLEGGGYVKYKEESDYLLSGEEVLTCELELKIGFDFVA